MKVKTSELKGSSLDWAVAKCEYLLAFGYKISDDVCLIKLSTGRHEIFSPSTNWSQAGPIIEREGIGLERDDQGIWFASYDLSEDCAVGATGPTALIAAMRLFVTKELDALALDVPDNLV